MAPNGEALVNSHPRDHKERFPNTKRLATKGGLQRAVSDLSLQLSKKVAVAAAAATTEVKLPPISEVEDAKCECCGMSEECTQEYIGKVRDKYCGKWICGLCSEAVKEELEKGLGLEEALSAHMGMCVKFNRIGRAYPALYHAETVKEILKKSVSNIEGGPRSKSISPRDPLGGSRTSKGGITRSNSCIPAITRDMTGY